MRSVVKYINCLPLMSDLYIIIEYIHRIIILDHNLKSVNNEKLPQRSFKPDVTHMNNIYNVVERL